ncbi:hypothetical protein F66182_7777 [Fusarium sp. NRRL 66182]|nr:hypothetical protein F66182_7777 [Fusarium sp. NRRL 66182]
MSVPRKARSWRQCLADDYEEEYGPLPNPVATFGSELVTAPSTPVLSSSIAKPDPPFISQLHDSIERIRPLSSPKRLQHVSRSDWRQDFSSSDSDEPDAAPWSLHAYAARLFDKASRKHALDGERMDGKPKARYTAKRPREQESMSTPPPNKLLRCDNNGQARAKQGLDRQRANYPPRSKICTHQSIRRQQLHSPPQTSSPTPPDNPDLTARQANVSTDRTTVLVVETSSSAESSTPPTRRRKHDLQQIRPHAPAASGPLESEMPPG